MSQYMLRSELDAICAKHKHQWLEGMTTRQTVVINLTTELSDRFVGNVASDIVRKIMAEHDQPLERAL